MNCDKLVINLIEAEVNLTDNILEAIWLLGDGTMINGDFDCGSRGTDHRVIESGIADFNRYDGQTFWEHVHEAYGAIRLVPEAMLALVKENQHISAEHRTLVEVNGYRFEVY